MSSSGWAAGPNVSVCVNVCWAQGRASSGVMHGSERPGCGGTQQDNTPCPQYLGPHQGQEARGTSSVSFPTGRGVGAGLPCCSQSGKGPVKVRDRKLRKPHLRGGGVRRAVFLQLLPYSPSQPGTTNLLYARRKASITKARQKHESCSQDTGKESFSFLCS